MIIVKLKGGLGNQLFQYAVGRALSLRNHCSLSLDISALRGTNKEETYRNYALDKFNIHAEIYKNDHRILDTGKFLFFFARSLSVTALL